MKYQRGFTIIEGFSIVWFFFILAAIIGWIMNIIAVAHLLFTDQALVITGMLVLRIIGIFVAPLGSILGYF